MKLKDADALMKEIAETYEYEYPTATGAFDEFASILVPNIIKNAPTVDAVPVVMCKDCKWYKDGELFTEKKMCYRHAIVRGIGKIVTDDEDFCSFGVRKEVQNDDVF